ncbi:MAG: DUF89 family protein [Clostridia bacterium]|nr:DUF89 family protein [Clostridia bacterium]
MTENRNDVIRLNSECIKCLLNKYLNKLPVEPDESTKVMYFQKILQIIADADHSVSAPEIVAEVTKLQNNMFGKQEDYTELKKYYNALMDNVGKDLKNKLDESSDPLLLAIRYSMLGNYIDFGAMDSVDENKLREMLDKPSDVKLDENEFKNLTNDLKNAKKAVFITDNCGEIALDKLLISEIQKEYPSLDITIIVRGAPVLNDATTEDALQIGLDKVAKVISNGSDVAGTCLDKISDEAKGIIDSADVIIAKGQGNFETLRYCNKNVYYMFLCKCQLFADRCNVPRFTPMLLNDIRMN